MPVFGKDHAPKKSRKIVPTTIIATAAVPK
jgi:hypothetical protein